MINIFTYGSLMCSDIMFKVADCRSEFVEAVLRDFFRSGIRAEEYPGIVTQPGTEVSGVLYLNLPAKAIKRLDGFEGEMYSRQEVNVISDNIGLTKAMAYVFKPKYKHLLTNEPWSYSRFLAVGKPKFEAAYMGYKSI